MIVVGGGGGQIGLTRLQSDTSERRAATHFKTLNIKFRKYPHQMFNPPHFIWEHVTFLHRLSDEHTQTQTDTKAEWTTFPRTHLVLLHKLYHIIKKTSTRLFKIIEVKQTEDSIRRRSLLKWTMASLRHRMRQTLHCSI